MKTICLLLVSASVAWAACPTGYTSIVDTVTNPANIGTAALFSGRVVITPPSVPLSSGGTNFGRTPTTVTITNGTLSVCLVPNVGASPINTAYSVAFQGSGGERWNETWIVPTSGSPVTLNGVRGSVSASPSAAVLWSQLAGASDDGTHVAITGRTLVLVAIPTSCSSQVSGTIWSNGGVLSICP